MQIPKPQLKKEAPAVIAQDWHTLLPSFLDDPELGDPDKARTVLQQAQSIMRAQEQRIHLLEKMALTDELTGLANRRGFSAAFGRELALAKRDLYSSGLLVMVDLDGFKEINDQWGHQTGDAYLRTVAQTFQEMVRSTDIVARLGGDEFAILMTHIDENNGAKRVARLEDEFNKSVMIYPGRMPQRLALRASFGFACYAGSDSIDAVMHSADLRLYAHKARNKGLVAAIAAD